MGAAKNTLIVFTMASILVLAGFSTILNDKAYAGNLVNNNGFTNFGDFKCWLPVSPQQTVSVLLRFQDQFGSYENSDWTQIEYCAAAEKDGRSSPFSFTTPVALSQHYQGWLTPSIPGPGTGQTVILDVPQFGETFTVELEDLEMILVPADKLLESGLTVFTEDKEQHWNCYNITRPLSTIGTIQLVTQHGLQFDTVEDAFILCAPAVKTILTGPQTGQQFGTLSIEEHMVCYNMLEVIDSSTNLPVQLFDQLTPNGITFIPGEIEKVCVTAFKSFPTVGGSMIPIDTTALLLAGVQSISMWMIPVVIAGVGISIFVVIRKNNHI